MNIITESENFQGVLTFFTPSEEVLKLTAKKLTIARAETYIRVITLHLTIENHQYQVIEEKELFNLKPQVKGFCNGEFSPKNKFKLEISLRPDFFPLVVPENQHDEKLIIQTIAENLLILNEQQESPVNQSENWYCLEAKQYQKKQDIGYETIWKNLDLFDIISGKVNEKDTLNILVEFIKKQTNESGENLSEQELKIRETIFEELVSSFEEISNIQGIENLENQENSDKVTQIIGNLLETVLASVVDKNTPESKKSYPESSFGNVFETMLDFFETEDWNYIEIPNENALRLAFQGEHGQWNCYAQAIEEYDRFLFYSVLPVNVPDVKMPLVCEFLTRANHNLGLGNFEMNFETGEVRYKTSLDAPVSDFTNEIFNKLVYVNVLTLDRYLPGIMNLIYGNVSPQEAIAQIESSIED